MADTDVTTAGAAPTTTETPSTEQAATPEPAAPKQSIAEAIREARADREARARAESGAKDAQSKLEKAMADLESRSKADDISDPIAWARGKKLDRETQAAFGQALLYDLVPEKTPPDFRVKLLESKIAREAKAREQEAQEAAAKAQMANAKAKLDEYTVAIYAVAKTVDHGRYPESTTWFGEDTESYSKSMMNTAHNMADAAAKAGKMADLTPANVARVLEEDIARRMKARDARSQKAATPKADETTQGSAASSTKGLNTGGPREPARTDKERIARAAAAAFPNR